MKISNHTINFITSYFNFILVIFLKRRLLFLSWPTVLFVVKKALQSNDYKL